MIYNSYPPPWCVAVGASPTEQMSFPPREGHHALASLTRLRSSGFNGQA